jgi:hypothetical protein
VNNPIMMVDPDGRAAVSTEQIVANAWNAVGNGQKVHFTMPENGFGEGSTSREKIADRKWREKIIQPLSEEAKSLGNKLTDGTMSLEEYMLVIQQKADKLMEQYKNKRWLYKANGYAKPAKSETIAQDVQDVVKIDVWQAETFSWGAMKQNNQNSPFPTPNKNARSEGIQTIEQTLKNSNTVIRELSFVQYAFGGDLDVDNLTIQTGNTSSNFTSIPNAMIFGQFNFTDVTNDQFTFIVDPGPLLFGSIDRWYLERTIVTFQPTLRNVNAKEQVLGGFKK